MRAPAIFMSALHLVHLADRPPRPWRNGGGLTRELLAWPPGAAAGDWRLRVSVADIAASGPFSAYPDVRRWFAVLEGAGVRLDLPRGAATVLAQGEPLAFDGEAAPMCHLLGGPTRDLNLMARRGAGLARLRKARPGETLEGDLPWRALYAAAPALLDIDDRTEPLAAGTLAWSDDAGAAGAALWRLRSGTHALWLTLEAQ